MADIDDDEPLFAKLSDTDLSMLRVEKNLITFALTVHVSPETRAECEKELEEGRKRGWKFESN